LASCSSEIRGTYLLVVVSVGASTGASAGAEAVVSSVTTAPFNHKYIIIYNFKKIINNFFLKYIIF